MESQTFLFNLQTQLTAGWDRLRGLTQDLAQALNVPNVKLLREEGQWRVQVARPYDPPVPLLDLLALLPSLPPATAVLGLSADGRPVTLNLDDENSAHVLVSGDAGAGKTVLLRTMATSLALNNKQAHVQLIVLAPGVSGARMQQRPDAHVEPLNLLPHMLADVTHKTTETRELLQFLVNEMEYRREQQVTRPRLVLFIDQVVTVLERGGQVTGNAVAQLAQRGAAVGIHLVLSTRRPHAPLLNTLLRAHLPARIVGRTEAPQAQQAATDSDATVQAGYLLGQGDFVHVGGGTPVHFQAAYVGDYDLHMSLRALHAQRPILLAQPFDPRVQMEAAPDTAAEEAASAQQAFAFTVNDGEVTVNEQRRTANERGNAVAGRGQAPASGRESTESRRVLPR